MDINEFVNLHDISAWQESEHLEWKLSTREHKEIVQTLVAFANKTGGIIVCGVDDKGAVYGQDISDATIREITQTILANTEERLYPVIEKLTLEGKSVLVVQIAESPLKPHSAYGRAYKRVGSSNHLILSSEYHVLLSQKRNGGGADSDVSSDYRIEDIDEAKVSKFIESANSNRNLNLPIFSDLTDVLTSLELMRAGILTKGAILLFGKNPQAAMPQAEFRVAHFADDTRATFLDQKIFTGNLFSQLEAVVAFVKNRLRQEVDTNRDGTRTDRVVPAVVITELVANALVHRDYRDASSSYLNIIGEEYIEIHNPGLLPAPKITPETLALPHPSVPINRRIARIFFLAGMIEQWGEGTRRVIREMKARKLPLPVWESGRGIVRVVIRLQP